MIPDRRRAARGAGRGRGRTAGCSTPSTGSIRSPRRVLGSSGLNTRRLFVLLPARGRAGRGGAPDRAAAAGRVSRAGCCPTPGGRSCTRRWAALVAGQAAGDGDLARGRGALSRPGARTAWSSCSAGWAATVVPSGALVSRFAAGWTGAEAADHRFAAEMLAEVARAELARAVREGGTGLTETALQARVVAAVEARGLVFDTPADRGLRPQLRQPALRAARRAGRDARRGRGGAARPLGRPEPRRPSSPTRPGWDSPGAGLPAQVRAGVGDGARRAGRGGRRGAGRGRGAAGRSRGSRPTARRAAVIEAAGLRRRASCTGPGTRSTATCTARARTSTTTRPTTTGGWCPGVGFSVEPGIYLPGEFGVRSEVNMYWDEAGPEVTPREPQTGADRRAGLSGRGACPFPNPRSRIRIASVRLPLSDPPSPRRRRSDGRAATRHDPRVRARVTATRRWNGRRCFNRQLLRFQRVTSACASGRAP